MQIFSVRSEMYNRYVSKAAAAGVEARCYVMRSEEGVFLGCESQSIKTMYGIDLYLDYIPPAIVLVYFLKRVCTVDV